MMANNAILISLRQLSNVVRANSGWNQMRVACRLASTTTGKSSEPQEVKKGKTPVGQLDDAWETAATKMEPQKPADKSDKTEQKQDPYAPFPDARNPVTGEIGGPRGPEPTRYGDWERKGRLSDF